MVTGDLILVVIVSLWLASGIKVIPRWLHLSSRRICN